MGSWGTDTFDNDAAQDYLDGLIEDFAEFIKADLQFAKSDGLLQRQTLAAVACLRVIVAAFDKGGVSMARYDVTSWMESYLAWIDYVARKLGATSDFIQAEKANAEREFSLLLNCMGGHYAASDPSE